jgi:hypothetical protein
MRTLSRKPIGGLAEAEPGKLLDGGAKGIDCSHPLDNNVR